MLLPRVAPPAGREGVDLAGDRVPVLVRHARTLHHLIAPTDTIARPREVEPPPTGNGGTDRWPIALAAAFTVAAGFVTRHRIGANSLWYDEAFTFGLVDRPLGDAAWRITHWELNQSPYYVAMLVWHRIGETEGFLRGLSAAFVIATIPVVFVLGRRLVDAWVGAVAAGVVAGHGLVVQWGQQMRGYTLATFLAVVATLLLVRAVERPSTARSAAYGVAAAALAYSHLVAGLVVVAHALSLLVLRPRPWALVRVAGITGAVLTAPLAWYVLTRQGDPLDWINEPSGDETYDILADVAGGDTQHVWVLGLLGLLGAGVLLTRARRAARGDDAWRATVPLLWLVVPLAGVLVSTYTVKPLLVARFLIVIVPAFALLVAVGVRRLPLPGSLVAVGALAVVSVQSIDHWYDAGNYEDWRGAVAEVSSSVQPGDDIVVVPGRAVHAVRYYGPALQTTSPNDFELVDGERLWVFDRVSRGATEWPVPEGFERWLSSTYVLVDEAPYLNVHVLLYERR